MADPAPIHATYTDLHTIPENMVGEIIDGELHAVPRPSPHHAKVASELGAVVMPPTASTGVDPADGYSWTNRKFSSAKTSSSRTSPAGKKINSPPSWKPTGSRSPRTGFAKSFLPAPSGSTRPEKCPSTPGTTSVTSGGSTPWTKPGRFSSSPPAVGSCSIPLRKATLPGPMPSPKPKSTWANFGGEPGPRGNRPEAGFPEFPANLSCSKSSARFRRSRRTHAESRSPGPSPGCRRRCRPGKAA